MNLTFSCPFVGSIQISDTQTLKVLPDPEGFVKLQIVLTANSAVLMDIPFDKQSAIKAAIMIKAANDARSLELQLS